ncbi:MAG TPA: hypothetical protein VHV26_01940 [Rhizomicrobium sp.]|jgi:hypothetical protein|nr:hypothetical protein [Rhizomicrobium sp.]
MPRFFFHVREGTEFSRDREGQELPDARAARQEAINSGREMLGEKLLHGGALDAVRIEISDAAEGGRVVDLVQANDVLYQGDKLRNYDEDVTRSAPVATTENPPRE